jgi:Rps23 Pro-64 3,4-dihydroxylase Tpa1-like proline 4-hydroxylase
MEYKFYTYPVSFCIIENYYLKDEIEEIEKELLSLKSFLLNPKQTGAAMTLTGRQKKENSGIFLDEFYNKNREKSSILTYNRKLFSPEVKYELAKGSWFFKYIESINQDSTLVSYYKKGDYYKSHADEGLITAIYYTWKEPKSFEGGEIYFGDFKVPITNNCLLIFPSCVNHSVNEVTEGEGRWAVTQFTNVIKNINNGLPIQTFPNFLDVTEFTKVKKFINGSETWSYSGISIENKGTKFMHLDLMDNDYFTKYLLVKISKLLNMNFGLQRVYANGQFLNQDGTFHTDSEDDKDFTFLLYMNEIDDESLDMFGGETQFKRGDGRIISIQPRTNCGLFFKSNLLHRGLAFRSTSEMRVTVAWKLSPIM